MTKPEKWRVRMLNRLDAARHYLETAGLDDCAKELCVQALDLEPRMAWQSVYDAAVSELERESQVRGF